MRFIDITAITAVNNVRQLETKAMKWKGSGAYPLTLDPEAVTAIEPYRDRENADAQEAPVEGYFTVTLSAGQSYIIDATARGQIVAAKNVAA